MNLKRLLLLCIAGGLVGFFIMYAALSCIVGKSGKIESISKSTICDYKVAIIYRAQFRTGEEGEKDFYHSVKQQVEWFRNHNYIVLGVNYEYDFDMTQNLILRFAIIKHKEKKNEQERSN
jgi:hypothetical protein